MKDDKKTTLGKWLKKNRPDFSQSDIDEVKNSTNVTEKLKELIKIKRVKI